MQRRGTSLAPSVFASEKGLVPKNEAGGTQGKKKKRERGGGEGEVIFGPKPSAGGKGANRKRLSVNFSILYSKKGGVNC